MFISSNLGLTMHRTNGVPRLTPGTISLAMDTTLDGLQVQGFFLISECSE